MSVSLLEDKINGLLIPGEAGIGIGGAGLIGANGSGNGDAGNGAAGNGAVGNGAAEVTAVDDSDDAMRAAGKGSSLTSSLTSNTDGTGPTAYEPSLLVMAYSDVIVGKKGGRA